MDDRQQSTNATGSASLIAAGQGAISDYPRDRLIQAWFEEQAARTPHLPALQFETQTLTYAALNERANQLAHYLRSLQVTPDTPLAICLEPGFDLLIGILAILKAGCGYVPLDPHYPVERLQYMLADTQASVLITHSDFVSIFANVMTTRLCLDVTTQAIDACATTNPDHRNQATDLAYVIYTSGSTGKPKGVMITHRNVSHFFHWFGLALPVTTDDIVDFSSSISFDFSVPNTLFPLTRGASIAICPEASRKDSFLYLNHLQARRVSVIKITPSHFRQLKEFVTPEHALTHLRWIIFGGESSYVKDVQDWLLQYPELKIFNEYGPTEATVATSWVIVDKENIRQFKHVLPIGKPALNSQLYILDDALKPVAVGERGELYIGGEGVARGYLNRPEVTAERFIPNPFSNHPESRLYKTGDVCRWLPDGNIEFIERVDHQVKIRGFRIEISEIEMNLVSHPGIREAAVLAPDSLIDQTGEKRLVAYCVAQTPEAVPSVQTLREHLQYGLPEYMIPTIFVMMDALPLTPNGKLDRKALPLPVMSRAESYMAPRNDMERSLAQIWCDVLNLPEIGIQDNFFDLGGHSLTASRIISRIGKQHKKAIKLQDFYQAPTIESLAFAVKAASDYQQEINQAVRRKSARGFPLSDMQFLLWLAQKSYSRTQSLNIVDRRRVAGLLDRTTLHLAFDRLLERHPVLSYYISSKAPMQYPQSNCHVPVVEQSLVTLTPAQQSEVLSQSLNELRACHFGKKGSPLIAARVFQLDDHTTELQLGLSHMISDELSPDIVFNDLSAYYTGQTRPALSAVNSSYQDYAITERHHFNDHLQEDMRFWKHYLKNTVLFDFPFVTPNVVADESYSTYLEVPEEVLSHLRAFCARHRLSVSDSLCAAVGMALSCHVELDPDIPDQSMVINVVKSTRNNDYYDDTIGFFVRTDLVKIAMNDEPGFLELSRRVQQSSLDTEAHQSCPVVVKLANLFRPRWQGKRVRGAMMNLLAFLCARLFPAYELHPDVLNQYGRLFIANTERHFLAQVNVLNSFMQDKKINPLFGFPVKRVEEEQNERVVANRVLEVSFDRNNRNRPYLIVAGCIPAALREQIASDILRHIKACENARQASASVAYP